MKRAPWSFTLIVGLSLAALGVAQQVQRPPLPKRPVAGPTPASKYAMQVTGVKHVVGTWRTNVYTTEFPADEWMISFPVAPTLSRQSGVKTTMTPEGQMSKEMSRAQRPFLALRVKAQDGVTPQSFSLAVRYEATLLARRLVPKSNQATVAPPLDVRDKFLYLASTPTLDFRAELFQGWLDNNKLRREKAEDEVEFARRVFNAMLGIYRYKDGVPIQAASRICDLAELDCDTLAVVFVSAMRANQVPARVLFCWPARTILPNAKGIISGHAQAEFFVSGAGWAPVDVANGLVAQAKGKDSARHFGEDDGTHLVAQLDPDYIVQVPTGPSRIDSMHPGPSVWTAAKKKADVRFRPQIWEVEVTPVASPASGAR